MQPTSWEIKDSTIIFQFLGGLSSWPYAPIFVLILEYTRSTSRNANVCLNKNSDKSELVLVNTSDQWMLHSWYGYTTRTLPHFSITMPKNFHSRCILHRWCEIFNLDDFFSRTTNSNTTSSLETQILDKTIRKHCHVINVQNCAMRLKNQFSTYTVAVHVTGDHNLHATDNYSHLDILIVNFRGKKKFLSEPNKITRWSENINNYPNQSLALNSGLQADANSIALFLNASKMIGKLTKLQKVLTKLYTVNFT